MPEIGEFAQLIDKPSKSRIDPILIFPSIYQLDITTYRITIFHSEIPRLDPFFLDVYTCTAEMAGTVVHVCTSGEGWLRRSVSQKGVSVSDEFSSSLILLVILVLLGSYVGYV